MNLPPFRTVTDNELRELWVRYPDPDVRRLILEVVTGRGVLEEVYSCYCTVHRAWRKEVGGNLIALHLMQTALVNERGRRGL